MKYKWSLSGFLKDWTNSFVVCQLALILMNVLFVIPWAVQFLSVDLPKRRKERMDKIAAQTSGSFSADWCKRREREREKDLVCNTRLYYLIVETLLYKNKFRYFFTTIKNIFLQNVFVRKMKIVVNWELLLIALIIAVWDTMYKSLQWYVVIYIFQIIHIS